MNHLSSTLTVLILSLWVTSDAVAHGPASPPDQSASDREIVFPDTAEHLTLSVDLHTHSVFSDGHVWPRIRVGEALRDGIDALAITEHLEWQPHIADIPHEDRNRAYEEAVASLPPDSALIIIAGSEITRSEPIGHMNAVFIEDANALLRGGKPENPVDVRAVYAAAGEWPAEAALDAAAEQEAFVFWNHAWWQLENQKARMTEFHETAINAGQLHGIEIANGDTYSPEAFQLAIDYGITPIGVSDVHNLIDWDYEPHAGGHRPVNLVFTRERSAAAIRDALFEGRTVVWFRNLLLGLEPNLLPLLEASLTVAEARWLTERSVLEVTFDNRSDARFELDNLTDHTLTDGARALVVPPQGSSTHRFRVQTRRESLKLSFRVRNALTGPDEHPTLSFTIQPAAE